MNIIIKWLLGIALIVMLVVFLVYLGSCVYANFLEKRGDTITLPNINKAQYTVTIQNTGNTLLTNSYEINGKVYILHNYWELVGQKYQFRNKPLVLDQAIFGTIKVSRRE